MFTYTGKEVRQITRLLKDTIIQAALRTHNTTENLLKPTPQINKYKQGGIYQMKNVDSPLKYFGQPGRAFNTRCKVHLLAVRNNNGNSGYRPHIWSHNRYRRIRGLLETRSTN
jgi:hypothetical protein